MTLYIFDSSIWIGSWREYYAEDIFPHIWKLIDHDITNGIIKSPPQVENEVKEDAVYDEWLESFPEVFLKPTIKQIDKAQEIVVPIWKDFPKLGHRKPTGKNPKADAYVIAYAEIMEGKVITQENPKKKTGMVEACRNRKVGCDSMLGYLRDRKDLLERYSVVKSGDWD